MLTNLLTTENILNFIFTLNFTTYKVATFLETWKNMELDSLGK